MPFLPKGNSLEGGDPITRLSCVVEGERRKHLVTEYMSCEAGFKDRKAMIRAYEERNSKPESK